MSYPMIFLAGAHVLLGLVYARTRGDRARRRAVEALVVYVACGVFLSWVDGGPGVKPTAFAALAAAIHLGASWVSVAFYFRSVAPTPAALDHAAVATPVPQVRSWTTDLAREHVGVRAEEGSDPGPGPDSAPEQADSYPPVVHAGPGGVPEIGARA